MAPRWPGQRRLALPEDPDRTLIVSPFLTDSTLQSIGRRGRTSLVSTTRAIDDLESATLRNLECWVLAESPTDPAFEQSPVGDVDDAAKNTLEDAPSAPAATPVGLHAKIVVTDTHGDPSSSQWVVGSANSTHNAHHGNFELVVRLDGPRKSCGVGTLLEPNPGDRDRSVLLDMIEPYAPGPEERDPEAEQAENLLDAAMIELAVTGCVLRVGERGDDTLYPLTAGFGAIPAGIALRCRPVTYGPEMAREVDLASGEAHWAGVSLQALTPYLVVTAEVSEPVAATRSRVLVADLVGAPAHRRERILADMLTNADDFLRYLILLLGSSGDAEAWATAVSSLIEGEPGGAFRSGGGGEVPILETLLRTAGAQPRGSPTR